jgi:sugar lactone lactonase YvrE
LQIILHNHSGYSPYLQVTISALYPQLSGDFSGMLSSSSFCPSRILPHAMIPAISNDSQAAAAEDRCADRRPHRENRIRRGILTLAVLCLSTLCGFATPVPPTAHFGGAQRVLTPTTYMAATIDAAGNIYATQGSNVLKYTLSSGSYSAPVTIYTATASITGFNMAVGADDSVYVITGMKFIRLTPSGSSYTPTITTTDLTLMDGIAVDSVNNVYVTGYVQNEIEIYAPSSSAYTLTGSATSVSAPSVLTVDASGVIYVATGNSQSIVRLAPGSGGTYTSTPVMQLPSSEAIAFINGIAIDPSGNVFYGTSSAMNIENPGPGTPGGLFEATPGSSGYTTSTLYTATATIDQITREANGNLFVSDSTQGLIEVQQGVVDFGTVAIGTSVVRPVSFTFDSAGSLNSTTPYQVYLQGATGISFVDAGASTCSGTSAYAQANMCTVNVTFTPAFAGLHSGAVTLNDVNGNVIATAPLTATGQGPQIAFGPGTTSEFGSQQNFIYPSAVAVDGKGDVYAANGGGRTVMEIVAADGVIPASPTFKTLGSTGSFSDPTALAVDGSGNLYVSDYSSHTVKEIVAVNGVIPDSPTINVLGSGFANPFGVAVDAGGNVYVADSTSNVVKEIIAVNGVIPASPVINTLGSGFNTPRGVAVDASGNVYVADYGNNAVKQIVAVNGGIPSSPTINTLGTGFNQPEGLFMDNLGDLYVADTGNNVVKEIMAVNGVISSSSTINTVNTGFDLLNEPGGVAVDGKGNLYIADSDNSEVKILDRSDAPTIQLSNDIGTPDTQLLTVLNVGNADLHFSPPSSGTNPSITSGFTWDGTGSGACPQISSSSSPGVLSAGASCSISISFTPASTQMVTGTLSLTDDTLNMAAAGVGIATQNVALTGTGDVAAPTITFTVPDHNFGDAPFTVSAASNSSGGFTYTVVSGPATISGSTVTLTGTGTVVLQASQAANGNYAANTATASFMVTATMPVVPTLSFAPIAAQIFGSAPFTVSATSASSGAVTYTVASGPATISGATVTLTGTGTVVLGASQVANGNYAAATATTSFVVSAGFTLAVGSGSGSTGASATATVTPGAAATFPLTFSLGAAATFPDALSLSATGLPPGATATFSPATIPAGSAATPVTLVIQTSSNQTAHNKKPVIGEPLSPIALGFLLLPFAGMKTVRRRLRQIPQLTFVLAITLSLGVVLGLSGCGGKSSAASQPTTSYTVAVTATDTVTGAHSSVNVTLNVQ